MMDTIVCPMCGTQNLTSAMNCSHCRINLRFALEHPEEIQAAKLEATWTDEASIQQTSPRPTVSVIARLLLGILSLVVGTVAIVPLFIIGEGSGSGIAAYAVISLILAILAYGLGKSDPEAWWVYASILCSPVTVLSLSSGAGDYFLAAIVMIIITLAGAYLGKKSFRMPQEPSNLP
jgi:hypothetical protein